MGSNPMHVARAAEALIDGTNLVNTGVSITLWVDVADAQRAIRAMKESGGGNPKALTTDRDTGRIGLKV